MSKAVFLDKDHQLLTTPKNHLHRTIFENKGHGSVCMYSQQLDNV